MEFSGKNFYLSNKKVESVIFKDFYYYCIIPRNIKSSDKNDSKWNKKNIKINDSRILYDKNLRNLFILNHC